MTDFLSFEPGKPSRAPHNLAAAAAALEKLEANPNCPAARLLVRKFTITDPSYRRRTRELLSPAGQDALNGMVFAKDAKKHLEEAGQTEEKFRQNFFMRMRLDDIQFFNQIPSGLFLHVTARLRPNPKLVLAQTRIYKEYRADYIRFLGQNFKPQLEDVGMDAADIAGMSVYGVLPAPWTVEHIRPRGSKRASQYPEPQQRNTFGNLILMPLAVNTWNNDLEQRQIHGTVKDSNLLIVSARPEYGPEDGVVILGSKTKCQIASENLRRLLWTEISGLPESIRFSGPPVRIEDRVPMTRRKVAPVRGIYV